MVCILSGERLSPSQKALSNQIHLLTAATRRLGLAHAGPVEARPEGTVQPLESGALECFDDQIATWLQPIRGKFQRELTQ